MNTSDSPIRDHLASALTGSLVAQRALATGVKLSTAAEITPDQCRRWARELDALGLNPELLSEHAIQALVLLFSEPDNREQMLRCLSSILWTILGDPSSGDPPEIYRRAAVGVWYSFLITLDPSIKKANA